MDHHILRISLIASMVAGLSILGCSGGTASAGDGGGAEKEDPNKTLCVDVASRTGVMKRVCCEKGETPELYGACGSQEVEVACASPTLGCIHRVTITGSEPEQVLCPEGLTCVQCADNDQAGMRFICSL